MTQPNNDLLGKVILLGMIGSAAGFAMYTKRTSSMIRQLDQISKNQARRKPPRTIGPYTKEEWDKIRPRIDKDDFV